MTDQEINKALAELCGLKECPYKRQYDADWQNWGTMTKEESYIAYVLQGKWVMPVAEWSPLEDIAQAFMVVDVMKEKGFGFIYHQYRPRSEITVAKFYSHEYADHGHVDEDRCRAICIAALNALGRWNGGTDDDNRAS